MRTQVAKDPESPPLKVEAMRDHISEKLVDLPPSKIKAMFAVMMA